MSGKWPSAVRREEMSAQGLGNTCGWEEWNRNDALHRQADLGCVIDFVHLILRTQSGLNWNQTSKNSSSSPKFCPYNFFLAVVIIVANFTLQNFFFCLKYFPKYAQNMGVGLFVLSGVSLMVSARQFRALGGCEEPLGLVGCVHVPSKSRIGAGS